MFPKKNNKILNSISKKIEQHLKFSNDKIICDNSQMKFIKLEKNKNISFQNEDNNQSNPSFANCSIQDLSFQAPNTLLDNNPINASPDFRHSLNPILENNADDASPDFRHSANPLLDTFGHNQFTDGLTTPDPFKVERKFFNNSIPDEVNSYFSSSPVEKPHLIYQEMPANDNKFSIVSKVIPPYRKTIDVVPESISDSKTVFNQRDMFPEDNLYEKERSLSKNPSPQVSPHTSSISRRQIPIESTAADDGRLISYWKVRSDWDWYEKTPQKPANQKPAIIWRETQFGPIDYWSFQNISSDWTVLH